MILQKELAKGHSYNRLFMKIKIFLIFLVFSTSLYGEGSTTPMQYTELPDYCNKEISDSAEIANCFKECYGNFETDLTQLENVGKAFNTYYSENDFKEGLKRFTLSKMMKAKKSMTSMFPDINSKNSKKANECISKDKDLVKFDKFLKDKFVLGPESQDGLLSELAYLSYTKNEIWDSENRSKEVQTLKKKLNQYEFKIQMLRKRQSSYKSSMFSNFLRRDPEKKSIDVITEEEIKDLKNKIAPITKELNEIKQNLLANPLLNDYQFLSSNFSIDGIEPSALFKSLRQAIKKDEVYIQNHKKKDWKKYFLKNIETTPATKKSLLNELKKAVSKQVETLDNEMSNICNSEDPKLYTSPAIVNDYFKTVIGYETQRKGNISLSFLRDLREHQCDLLVENRKFEKNKDYAMIGVAVVTVGGIFFPPLLYVGAAGMGGLEGYNAYESSMLYNQAKAFEVIGLVDKEDVRKAQSKLAIHTAGAVVSVVPFEKFVRAPKILSQGVKNKKSIKKTPTRNTEQLTLKKNGVKVIPQEEKLLINNLKKTIKHNPREDGVIFAKHELKEAGTFVKKSDDFTKLSEGNYLFVVDDQGRLVISTRYPNIKVSASQNPEQVESVVTHPSLKAHLEKITKSDSIDVVSAGEFRVHIVDGKSVISELSNKSGRWRGQPKNLEYGVKKFREYGAPIHPKAKIKDYSKSELFDPSHANEKQLGIFKSELSQNKDLEKLYEDYSYAYNKLLKKYPSKDPGQVNVEMYIDDLLIKPTDSDILTKTASYLDTSYIEQGGKMTAFRSLIPNGAKTTPSEISELKKMQKIMLEMAN